MLRTLSKHPHSHKLLVYSDALCKPVAGAGAAMDLSAAVNSASSHHLENWLMTVRGLLAMAVMGGRLCLCCVEDKALISYDLVSTNINGRPTDMCACYFVGLLVSK